MDCCSGLRRSFVLVLLSVGILLVMGTPSHAVGLGVAVYGGNGYGEIEKSYDDWATDNRIEKKGTARYINYGLGLVFETSPFSRRFSFRITPGLGLGRISKKYTRKEYDTDTDTMVSTEKVKQKYNVVDFNLTSKFCFKVMMRDNFNIWIGPMVKIGKSRDYGRDYNDFSFGGGVTAGMNIRLTNLVYLTASPSACILYSGNSRVDLIYWEYRGDVGVMTSL